jgi:hypothetical protein
VWVCVFVCVCTHTHIYQDVYGWELLFNDADGGVQSTNLLRPGTCIRPFDQFFPLLNPVD